MSAAVTHEAPRVWVGCLACYNSGRLVGVWVDAASAEDLSLADVHREAGRVWLGCEEVWCLDTDGIPNPHEMGVSTAAAWGELFERVGAERQRRAAQDQSGQCHPAGGQALDRP